MRTNTLSQTADRLLSGVDRDPQAPHYGEESFRRKIAGSNRRAQCLPVPQCGREANFLLKQEWRDVILSAGLTRRQLEVLVLRLDGHTFEAIGERGGHTKQGAQSIYFQAAKKLVRAWMEYPYRGLAQIYKEEVRRGVRPRRLGPSKIT